MCLYLESHSAYHFKSANNVFAFLKGKEKKTLVIMKFVSSCYFILLVIFWTKTNHQNDIYVFMLNGN